MIKRKIINLFIIFVIIITIMDCKLKKNKEHYYPVWNKECKWGYIDRRGREIIEFKYDEAKNFSEGLAAVRKRGKWGYINKKGEEVIKLKYEEAKNFSEGIAAVREGGKWGYIDRNGKEVIGFKYAEAKNFSEGLAAVRKKEGRWGYINKRGKEVIKPIFKIIRNRKGQIIDIIASDNCTSFYNGIAFICFFKGKWNLINKKGEIVKFKNLLERYKELEIEPVDKENRIIKVRIFMGKSYKIGFINKKGKIKIPFKNYLFSGIFSEGLIPVEGKNKLYGYIDMKGREVIPCRYDIAESFSEGIAPVAKKEYKKNGVITYKWGFINREGKYIIKPKYEEIYYLNEDWLFPKYIINKIAKVKKDKNIMYIDLSKKGKIIWKSTEKCYYTE